MKFNNQIELLAKGRLPQGFANCRVHWQGDEWQSFVGRADLSSLVVPADVGDTPDEVYQKLQMESLASKVILQQLAETRRLSALTEEASLSNFEQECTLMAEIEIQAFCKTSPSTVITESTWTSFKTDVKEQGYQLYIKQVQNVAIAKQFADGKTLKKKEQEVKAIEQAALFPPE